MGAATISVLYALTTGHDGDVGALIVSLAMRRFESGAGAVVRPSAAFVSTAMAITSPFSCEQGSGCGCAIPITHGGSRPTCISIWEAVAVRSRDVLSGLSVSNVSFDRSITPTKRATKSAALCPIGHMDGVATTPCLAGFSVKDFLKVW